MASRCKEASSNTRILDVGTGTGCIVISILLGIKASNNGRIQDEPGMTEAIATDLIPEALELAAANTVKHGLDGTIEFRQGSMFEPLWTDDRPFDLIVSNPPYVSDEQWDELPENVRCHEPESALRGGSGGLELVESLLASAGSWLNPGGLMLVEIGADQADRVLDMARRVHEFTNSEITIHKDHEGHDRVLSLRMPV